MRTLTFTQITDSRFDPNPAAMIREYKRQVIEKLKKLPGVNVEKGEVYRVEFDNDPFGTLGNEQYRIQFWVQKTGRKTTWNDVYSAVNSVNPVPFKFV